MKLIIGNKKQKIIRGNFVIILTLIFLCGQAIAQSSHDHVVFQSEDGSFIYGIRCGTTEASPPIDVVSQMKDIDRWVRENAPDNITIPVALHVIYNSSWEGVPTDQQVRDQFDILNQAYANSGFSFYLYHYAHILNDTWFTAGPGTLAERDMKQALAIDPANVLNFYTLKPVNNLLGWATFPWHYPESDPMHGICIRYDTFPGGSAFPYDEGDTATHEIGHYLGLFHTFQNGCRFPGDYRYDTPSEMEPGYGCPENRDTCPNKNGLDPIHNYMDYSDDACMDEFTAGQGNLMKWAVSKYRPNLLY